MTPHPTVLILPVAIPLFLGALSLLFQSMAPNRRVALQRILAGLGLFANMAVAGFLLFWVLQRGPQAFQLGLWPAPFGITVYLDTLTALMLVMVGLLSLLIYPFALETIDPERARLGFFPMLLFLLMGANGAFITGDLFNLYVFYEVLLMASFVLLTLGCSQPL